MDSASAAIALFDLGEYTSLAAAGRATGASPSTINDRRKGILPRRQATYPNAHLTRYQEEILVKYIQDL